jgi:AcrR family transcriptional regulator
MPIPAQTPARRRNRRGEGSQLRAELLDAALRLLENPDSEGRLSIRSVAAEAGVAAQSVYLQFADLAALRWAVYERLFDLLAATVSAATDGLADPRAAIEAWASAYLDFADGNPARYQAMFGAVGQHQPEWDPGELPGSAVFAGLQRLVTANLARRHGATPDPFSTTICIWASLHGLASLRISKPTFPWPAAPELTAQLLHAQLTLRPAP